MEDASSTMGASLCLTIIAEEFQLKMGVYEGHQQREWMKILGVTLQCQKKFNNHHIWIWNPIQTAISTQAILKTLVSQDIKWTLTYC
jgi:hypothetical protein